MRDFCKDFCDYWEQHMGSEKKMPYGPGRKQPNLLMKHMALWDRFDDLQRHKLIGFLHIPFDKYALSILRNSIPDPWRSIIGRIPNPKNATMNFVDNEAKYDALLASSRAIANEAEVPPIYLDVLAWNKSHTHT